MATSWYTGVAIAQVTIVSAALIGGTWYAVSAKQMTDQYIWKIAQTVVIFMPLALAWFGIFSAMFLENVNLLLPVLVGVTAVGFNLIVDKVMSYLISEGKFATFL